MAFWREGWLARKVLLARTHGYRQHLQLTRFKAHANPIRVIDSYLWFVQDESGQRSYRLDSAKLSPKPHGIKLSAAEDQLGYEFEHLRSTLKLRDKDRYRQTVSIEIPQANPLFRVSLGGVEGWEKV